MVLRIWPATFPLVDGTGQPIDVQAWLRHRGPEVRSMPAWCAWNGQHDAVRRLATKVPPDAARAARRRKVRQAQRKGRVVSTTALALAGWVLLVTTVDERTWSNADVLRLDRARWQVELVDKRLKSVLDLNQIRSKHVASAEATVRALLVAWAVPEQEADWVRPQLAPLLTLPAVIPASIAPVSSWRLTALCLDTLRQQVQGQGTVARLRVCLPRLQRFLIAGPRRRVHQETNVRAWLTERAGAQPVLLRAAA